MAVRHQGEYSCPAAGAVAAGTVTSERQVAAVGVETAFNLKR